MKTVLKTFGGAILIALALSVAGWCSAAPTLVPIVVNKGAGLIKIARQYCISENSWKQLAKINNLQPPFVIYADDTIMVPLELLRIQEVAARVVSVVGEVYIVDRQNKLRNLKNNDLVYPGQTIVSERDGYAHLVFPDHRYTRISNNSKLSLTYVVRLSDGSLKAEFFLEKGAIIHAVRQKLKPNENFNTRTPATITGVRGTEFRIKVREHESSTVETLSGQVCVKVGEKKVMVKNGEGIRIIGDDGAKQELSRLPPAPAVPEVNEIYRKLPVEIAIAPDGDIKSYRLRVTEDEVGDITIFEKLVPGGDKIRLVELTDGVHYGVLTYIDKNGFESPPAEPFKLRVRTLPGPPMLKQEGTDRSFSASRTIEWLNTSETAKYHVQLADNADFTSVLKQGVQVQPVFEAENLAPGNYFFRVCAIGTDGFRSNFSSTYRWRVDETPELKERGGEVKKNDELRWSSAGAGISYDLQISTNRSFFHLIADETNLDKPVYSLPDFPESGRYYVRVRGVLPDGQKSPWSSPQELVVPSPGFHMTDLGVLALFLGIMIL
ncbi:FecR domain-containing protein [Desulforhopalus singaporensis]|uniref:FecR family protein n=1 Tax=Desulforhopalus singaporensis TaxID=91360 RepID=A0A1H0JCG2_9BACT|nr:FecR domain-containing protein [Desulforhopalus singaporensis]SDO41213.1 FecR family protein [Desulforhopalus singaporensis]